MKSVWGGRVRPGYESVKPKNLASRSSVQQVLKYINLFQKISYRDLFLSPHYIIQAASTGQTSLCMFYNIGRIVVAPLVVPPTLCQASLHLTVFQLSLGHCRVIPYVVTELSWLYHVTLHRTILTLIHYAVRVHEMPIKHFTWREFESWYLHKHWLLICNFLFVCKLYWKQIKLYCGCGYRTALSFVNHVYECK